jgi:hypothetical protein
MTTTKTQNKWIAQTLNNVLEEALIEGVKDTFKTILDGDYQDLIDTISEEFRPDEVFPDEALEVWALTHGFEKKA